MSGAEIFYLVVVFATFIGFSATLAAAASSWERHKADRVRAGD